MLRVIFKAVDLEQIPLAHEGSSGEDQQHDVFGIRRLGYSGKEPDVQLCVQADAGSGSWLKPSLRPARLNTALALLWELPVIPNMLSRASELISLGERARAAIKGHPSSVMRDPALYAEFRTAGLSFLANLFGKEHSYYKDFDSRVRRAAVDEICHGIGVMRAVQGEISAGWLESTRQLIAAEVFTDFLEMADHLLQEGYKDAAAVMIGGVLEGRLKGLAVKNGIAVCVMKDGVDVPKKADRLNSELAAGGVYAKLDQKNVTAWLDLRNKAAHADYTSYTLEQVKLMRASVADFLARCT